MQVETRKENSLRLSELADEINNAARECDDATVATLAGGMLTVQAAIRAGKSLARVKAKLEHGKFLKWLADNCPKINEKTAQRWMKLANGARVSDLSDAKSITDAFRIVAEVQGGVDKEEKRALGTAAVDLYCELAAKLAKKAQGVIDVVADVEAEELPIERREQVRLALQPLVNLGARMGVVAVVQGDLKSMGDAA
jgi:hypothetical protein